MVYGVYVGQKNYTRASRYRGDGMCVLERLNRTTLSAVVVTERITYCVLMFCVGHNECTCTTSGGIGLGYYTKYTRSPLYVQQAW